MDNFSPATTRMLANTFISRMIAPLFKDTHPEISFDSIPVQLSDADIDIEQLVADLPAIDYSTIDGVNVLCLLMVTTLLDKVIKEAEMVALVRERLSKLTNVIFYTATVQREANPPTTNASTGEVGGSAIDLITLSRYHRCTAQQHRAAATAMVITENPNYTCIVDVNYQGVTFTIHDSSKPDGYSNTQSWNFTIKESDDTVLHLRGNSNYLTNKHGKVFKAHITARAARLGYTLNWTITPDQNPTGDFVGEF